MEHPGTETSDRSAVVMICDEAPASNWLPCVPRTEGMFPVGSSERIAGAIDITLALMTPDRSRPILRRTPPNRVQIERALGRIDESIPVLIGPGGDQTGFWLALSEMVVESLGRASPADDEWIMARLGAILAMHGIRG